GEKRHAVIEVDVGDERQRRLLADLAEGLAGFFRRYCDAQNLAARGLEGAHLRHRLVDISRVRAAHRLHGYGSIAAHGHVPDHDLPRGPSLDHDFSLPISAIRAMTSSTSCSRVDAPAVTPTTESGSHH